MKKVSRTPVIQRIVINDYEVNGRCFQRLEKNRKEHELVREVRQKTSIKELDSLNTTRINIESSGNDVRLPSGLLYDLYTPPSNPTVYSPSPVTP